MRVHIWCDGAAMPNGGPAGAGYVVVGGVHLLGSEALGDATNNVAEYTAVRSALRAAADAGATSAHVRMDSPVVFGHLSGASRARAEHLIQLKEEVEAQVARYPGRVTFARIPRERNGVADELAKDGAPGLEGAERRSAAIGSATRPPARSGGSTGAVTLARAPLPYPRSTGPFPLRAQIAVDSPPAASDPA
jgi:ribonuclease H / adenosylcobalamin/alpha-ribazole phosphatase